MGIELRSATVETDAFPLGQQGGILEGTLRFLFVCIIIGHVIAYNNSNHIQRRCSRFFTLSSQRRELSPTHTRKWPRHNRVQITCNTSSAYHVQVSCYMPHTVLFVSWANTKLFAVDVSQDLM